MLINLKSLFFFDLSAVIIMLVLAYLSKHLGEALKIKPYYKFLYVTATLIILASGADLLSGTLAISIPHAIPLTVRFAASLAAFMVCLRYWNWLFTEYFKN